MAKKTDGRKVADVALRRHPHSYADQLRIKVGKDTPAPLYQWLIASLMFSTRIAADQAKSAALALFDQGWRTPQRMVATTWNERVRVLNRSGYARYDESTARYIGDTTALLLDRYGGDLRRLRRTAEHEPDRERALLKEFKGIGDVGADIFFREVQVAWDEHYPFADRRALTSSARLGLADNAEGLAQLVDRREDLPRLLAALVMIDLAGETDEVLRVAA